MQEIKLKDRKIYRADFGKKVKFANSKRLYDEIVVSLDNNAKVEEVN